MLQTIIKTASSFLTNEPPPGNFNDQEKRRLGELNHLESKKFYIVMTSVLILMFFFFSGVGLLFMLPPAPEIISAFVTIFTKTVEILAVVIAFYVSAKTAVDLKYNSNSTLNTNNTTEVIKEENITIIHTNQKEDDYVIN